MTKNETLTDDSLYLASIYRIHAAIFVESAKLLAERLEVDPVGTPTTLAAIPVYLLSSHAAELFLKAALLKRGFGDRDLREFNYRHNLGALLDAVQQAGVCVTAETEEMVRGFSTQHEDHSLRYTALVDDRRPTYMPPVVMVFAMLEELLLLTRISTQGV